MPCRLTATVILLLASYFADASVIPTPTFGMNDLLPDGSGNYSWQGKKEGSDSFTAGRLWDWLPATTSQPAQLVVNQALNSFATSPITDAASIKIINDIQKRAYGNFEAAYDATTNEDIVYAYGYNGNTNKVSDDTNTTIAYSQCTVAHNSTQVAKDVRCGAEQTVNVQSLLPDFKRAGQMDIGSKVLPNGHLAFFINQKVDEWVTYHAVIWTNDEGKTWIVGPTYSDSGQEVPSLNTYSHLPLSNGLMNCPRQNTVSIGADAQPKTSYVYPLTFSCLNYAQTTSPVKYTDYVMKATDLGEAGEMYFTAAANGLWVTGGDDYTRLYYLPYDTTKPQIELPAMPTTLQQGGLKFAVFTEAGSADSVVACSYTKQLQDGMYHVEAQVEAATTDSTGKWAWKTLPNSTISLAPGQVCALSNDQASADINTSTAQNFAYDKKATVWIYPTDHKNIV